MNNKFLFDCNQCSNRCDGISKKVYNFKNDVEYSEEKEKELIDEINSYESFSAHKCEKDGYPDIEILSKETGKTFYIEVKCQRRTFMAVKRLLPSANLQPSETLALNLSDLKRYFDIHKEKGDKIFLLWCVENRPCIIKPGNINFYSQDIEVLEKIYNFYGDKRYFVRRDGFGDIDEFGNHKGVVGNYHFSINELNEWSLTKILQIGKN